MSEKSVIYFVNILKGIINVYFDTFFVFYFFKVANYEVLPLAKYYLTLYLFVGIGFFLIRNVMKKNLKVPYFRIGISLQAIYIALIMLLKENIINYIFLVGFIRGIADAFFHFPKNIMETEKINNIERQKFLGIISIINKISAIVVPLILGITLTYMSYTNLGKIFFVLFIVMFIMSFYIEDYKYDGNKKSEIKKFLNLCKRDKNIRNSMIICYLSGFTYASGVLSILVTITKINIFKTNLNLGFVDSACAVVFLLSSILFTTKMKKEHFGKISLVSGIISFITLIVFAYKPAVPIFVIYLFINNSLIGIIQLISNNINHNLSNSKEIKDDFKMEYYLFRDIMFCVSRCTGYVIMLLICLCFGNTVVNYILVIPAISILIETIMVNKLSKVKIK